MSSTFDDLSDDGNGRGFVENPPDDHADASRGVPALLDTLTDLIERSRAMPMSSSVLVNRNEALELIDAIYEALPDQLTHADRVLSDADEALDVAHNQAQRLLAEAHQEAEGLVARHEITRQAEQRAAEIIAEAEQTAQSLRHEANDYCDRRLADFEIDLGRLVSQVQSGRAKLASLLAEDEGR